MSRRSGCLLAGAAVLLCVPSFLGIQAGAQALAFNRTTLAGWHVLGPAGWRVENGEIVASSGGGAGWLVLDRAYEDLRIRLLFRCHQCETGVLVRGARAGDGTEGSYLALAGSDAGTMYRMNVDARGQETDRRVLGKPLGQTNRPVEFTLKPDGWNEADLAVRGSE